MCNHRCSGKAISITYTDYVFVAVGAQREMRMRHIFVCVNDPHAEANDCFDHRNQLHQRAVETQRRVTP